MINQSQEQSNESWSFLVALILYSLGLQHVEVSDEQCKAFRKSEHCFVTIGHGAGESFDVRLCTLAEAEAIAKQNVSGQRTLH